VLRSGQKTAAEQRDNSGQNSEITAAEQRVSADISDAEAISNDDLGDRGMGMMRAI